MRLAGADVEAADLLRSFPPEAAAALHNPSLYKDAGLPLPPGSDLSVVDWLDSIQWFRGAPSWAAWRAYLCALFALPMSPAEALAYSACTGRKSPPTSPAAESWVIVGRRGRKSAIAALIGCYLGCRDYRESLAPGERASIPILSKSKDEARKIHDFARAILTTTPPLAALLESEPTGETIHLRTRVDIEIRAVSLVSGRSRCIPAALLDEVAFFKSEDSAAPDVEIIRGIRPAMATVPHPLLLGLSSPYAQRGVLYSAFTDHFGRDHDVLVWRADTLTMHDSPLVREAVRKAFEDDPVSAEAEYGRDGVISFRTDVEDFISAESVSACVIHGREQLPRQRGVWYYAFTDPSGGSTDSMTLGIAHWDSVRHLLILDCIREWRSPFDPHVVVKEAAACCSDYGVSIVTGDRYGGVWPRAEFRKHGIRYVVTDKTKSELYLSLLPLINARAVELLDIRRLTVQLTTLDRAVSRGGRETVDHAPGGHDDLANAAAGALVMAGRALKEIPQGDPDSPVDWQQAKSAEFQAKLKLMREGKDPMTSDVPDYIRYLNGL